MKPIGEFKTAQGRPRSYCQMCSYKASSKRKNLDPEKSANRSLSRYSITLAEYQKLLERQGGTCICGAREPGGGHKLFCVDHDHSCCPGTSSCGKCIRGLLCRNCNIALGLLNDDIERLKILITYLECRANKNS